MKTRTFELQRTDDIWTITVKQEFFDKCPLPHLYDINCLVTTEFNLTHYLHSTEGPAATHHTTDGLVSHYYYIDGTYYHSREQWQKRASVINFENKIDKYFND